MAGFSPLCAAPEGGLTGLSEAVTWRSVRAVFRDSRKRRSYLLELDVALADINGGRCGLAAGPAGGGAIGGTEAPVLIGGRDVVRLSDTGHITNGADMPAHTPYAGRAAVPLVISRSVSLCPESRASGRQDGESTVEDGDDRMARLAAASAVHGRRIRVLAGARGAALSDFTSIFEGVARDLKVSPEAVRLSVRDNARFLERPIQENTYTGAGGLDGPENLAGRLRPLLLGACLNLSPVLVDPVWMIYQIHDGALASVDGVYDRGAALTPDGNTSDLYSVSVADGTFKTDLDRGLFRVGTLPDGRITADATAAGGSTPGALAEQIFSRSGIPSRYVDAGSIESLKVMMPGPAGLWLPDGGEAERIFDRLMRSAGAGWYVRRDGRVRVGRLTEPTPTSRILSLDGRDIIDLREMSLPRAIAPATWRRRVGYGRNHTVQQRDVAPSVSDARRQFLAEPWRMASAMDGGVRGRFPLATDPPMIESPFVNKPDAEALASALQALHGKGRRLFSVRTQGVGHLVDIYDTIFLKWPRPGLSDGRSFKCVGLRENCARSEVVLLLWG